MLEATVKDFWSLYGAEETALVIPTHATRSLSGAVVINARNEWMKEAQRRFPGFKSHLGQVLRKHGNVCAFFYDYTVLTFPIRREWYNPADLELIQQSTAKLADITKMFPALKFYIPKLTDEVLQRGQSHDAMRERISWEIVKPVLAQLSDQVFVMDEGEVHEELA